jgi:hypothetical protein
MLDFIKVPPVLATTEVVRPQRGHFSSFNLYRLTRNPYRACPRKRQQMFIRDATP